MAFQKQAVQDFIGRGITLPLELTNGRPQLKSGFELVRASIKTILGWPYNTRFFLSEFGSRIDELLEEPNDDILKNLIQTFITDAISKWEKRVVLTSVEIEDVNPVKIQIRLYYRFINSNVEDNLIYPFYRQINY